MNGLFRAEVLQARAHHLHGEIILARPFSSWILVVGAIVLTLVILSFLTFGTYTKRTTVSGLLQPSQGAIRIQPPMTGTLIERRVNEGQEVKKGDILFAFSDERRNTEGQQGKRLTDLRSESLQQRRISLEQSITNEQLLEKQTRQEIAIRKKNLQDELGRNQQEIELQNRRIDAAEKILKQHELMAKEGFVSEIALQEKDDHVASHRAHLLALQRQQSQLKSNIASSQNEFETAPGRAAVRIAELKRALAMLTQEESEFEGRDRFAITAPTDGLITSITAQFGQISSGQTIATLIPKDGEIVAHLFAPSRAVGFILVGQNVRLRYQAYPYQKYGQHKGVVVEVSRSPIAPSDLPAMMPAAQVQEGMYRIVVKLEENSSFAKDARIKLLPGMIIDADIDQESRRLIEWMASPLYTLMNRIN